MRKYQLFILSLWVFTITLFIPAFHYAGNPLAQKQAQYDQTRLNDFAMISSELTNYAQQHQVIPASLSTLPTITQTKDPQTQKQYVYTPHADKGTYELCATFSTDSKDAEVSTSSIPYGTNQTHKKGYDCIMYSLPTYLLTPTIIPYPTTPMMKASGSLTHACSSIYNGTCRPSCLMNEKSAESDDAIADCAVNSKGNPVCCIPEVPTPTGYISPNYPR